MPRVLRSILAATDGSLRSRRAVFAAARLYIGGVAARLLGSETLKVLPHSKVPVLVCR